ncbi:hypothetical protein GCK32_007149 [Trichostrongylus colubriformis]|uniref:SWIM-type domain-containing protein n=1 Tax=Trichostrongylus colubriformis TaxID=6319 RepID=A0AAN8F4K5_TRICO
MSDDTNSFYNGFLRALPSSDAVKLLCCIHILQAIKRNCRTKLLDKNPAGMVIGKVRSLCRTSDRGDFGSKYSSFLTHLQQLGEHQFCSYMKDTCPRVIQWGGFARQNACMNTSILGERFHKRLKHELPDAKPNMCIDRPLEVIVTVPVDMEEERHQDAERTVPREISLTAATSPAREGNQMAVPFTIYASSIVRVIKWGDCQARGYAFRCDCEEDIQSGISCLHVHASLIYAASDLCSNPMQHSEGRESS